MIQVRGSNGGEVVLDPLCGCATAERLEAPPQANPFAKAEREVKAGKQEEML
jgi:hypothetical protein